MLSSEINSKNLNINNIENNVEEELIETPFKINNEKLLQKRKLFSVANLLTFNNESKNLRKDLQNNILPKSSRTEFLASTSLSSFGSSSASTHLFEFAHADSLKVFYFKKFLLKLNL